MFTVLQVSTKTGHQLIMLLEATVTLVVTKWKNTVQHRLSRRFDIPDKFISAQNSRVFYVTSSQHVNVSTDSEIGVVEDFVRLIMKCVNMLSRC